LKSIGHAENIIMRVKGQLMMAGIDVEQAGLRPGAMKREVQVEAEESARASVLLRPSPSARTCKSTRATCRSALVELANARGENVNKAADRAGAVGRIDGVPRAAAGGEGA